MKTKTSSLISSNAPIESYDGFNVPFTSPRMHPDVSMSDLAMNEQSNFANAMSPSMEMQTAYNISGAASSSMSLVNDSFYLEDMPVEIVSDSHAVPNVTYGNDLENYLRRTSKGQSILHYYSLNKCLNNTFRNLLVAVIIDAELQSNPDRKIDQMTFLQLAKDIERLFPTEKSQAFYIPAKKLPNNKKLCTRGKLWERYNNVRKKFQNSGLIKKRLKRSHKKKETTTAPIDSDSAGETQQIISCLKIDSFKSFEHMKSFWEKTHTTRLSPLFSSENVTNIASYMKEFPVLKTSFGDSLIKLDFDLLYPDKKNLLFSMWPTLEMRIVEFMRQKCETDKSLRKNLWDNDIHFQEGGRNLQTQVLQSLAFLFPQKIITKNYRPSKKEMMDSFILLVSSDEEMREMLESRKTKLNSFGLPNQPLPVVVTNSENESKAYVAVCDHLYPCSSSLDAVDLCFKIIHVVNARYAPECEFVWLFLQKYVYKIHTEYDISSSSVAILATKLGL